MNTREQFGSYILLKKLSEDSLGETFRAGRFGSQGIEQVVLLRVFNGQGLDGSALWQKVADRKELIGGLRSPNLASGIDFGELQGVPYVAYDYVSGKNLARLLEQANRQISPLPPDHALLIIERIALGLTAALETRLGGDRVLHGFVVPDLVMVSNEGEAKLLGFEASPGLRDMASSNAAVRGFERYLAPEALAGQPPHRSDDVYSLGAILYELLTGEALPSGNADLGNLLEQAKIASDDEPVPQGIRQLLQRSLSPRDQRIGDAASWHKALSQVMVEGQYNPTTFNLAFFMHSLFRDEIEKESRELQSEQKIEPPTATAEMAAVSSGGREAGADTVMVSSADIETEPAEDSGSKKGLFLGLAAVAALVLVGALLYFFVFGAEDPASTPSEQAAQVPPAASTAAQEETPAGPTQEEIQAELDRMREEMAESLAAQNAEMQKELADRYESRLEELQGQYEQAQQEAETQKALEQAQEEAEALAQQAAEAEAAEEAAQAARDEDAAAEPETTDNIARTQVAETQQPATSRAVPQSPPPPAETTPREPAKTAQAAPPPPPPASAVRRGQLVEPGPGVVPPRLVNQAPARYPPAAKRFRREATIVVRVLVDETGKVTDVKQVSKEAGLGLDESAMKAARRSTFRPATKSGVPVKMWHSLRFDFKP